MLPQLGELGIGMRDDRREHDAAEDDRPRCIPANPKHDQPLEIQIAKWRAAMKTAMQHRISADTAPAMFW
jgi:hypothetical protein